MDQRLAVIKRKKIGLILQRARELSGHSENDCAQWLNLDLQRYQNIETGEMEPSLPQLESLSAFLHVPYEFFLNGLAEPGAMKDDSARETNSHFLDLRNRIIALLIKQRREEKNLTLEQLSAAVGISSKDLASFEDDFLSIPLFDLKKILQVLDLTEEDLYAKTGQYKHGSQPELAPAAPELNIPADLLEFISKPVNQPYVALAKRLSLMDTQKLREIAASLLEITY